ncbi:MAG: hypothetical protein J7M12_03610 [Candidatus Hydrogenedentes bacterium]|nr:hypothetical protein [Candidatus Hydrogenedentota bacterium]
MEVRSMTDKFTVAIGQSALSRARTYTLLWRDENVSLVLRELERIDMERYDNE